MGFSPSQYAELIAAAVGAIVFFLLLFRFSERTSLGLLLVLTPFQIIDSQYGTLNTVLIYVASFAFLLQGRLSRLPFAGPIFFVLFALMVGFSQSHPAARMHHILYLFGFFSNVLLFYMVYNFILRTGDWRYVLRIFLIVNVLVAVYCALQFSAGNERFTFFGIEEFSLNPPRNDGRLVGPFKATAATAEYLTFQCVILAYMLINGPTKRMRRVILTLLPVNFLFLIATGNRGGFVTIVMGALMFLYVYRRQLGLVKITTMLASATILYSLIAIVAVNFTQYGMLFDRLEETEIESGVPDTRGLVWRLAWEHIQEKPILGHGPRLSISSRQNQVADIPYVRFPHNLLLHVLYTTGIVGVIAWLTFFLRITGRLWSVRHFSDEDPALAGLPRLGLVLLAVLFVSQLRIEFLRDSLLDYQHYLFTLFAMFLATGDMLVARARKRQPTTAFARSAQGAEAATG